MEPIGDILLLGVISLVAAVSPGPDFIVVTKNSLLHSRRVGFLTALGVGAGILVHVTYSIAGIGLLISQSVLFFTILKIIGALYLLFLGLTLLIKHPRGISPVLVDDDPFKNLKEKLSPLNAFREGFFTNALNPKATLFFLGIFTQVIDPTTPVAWQAGYGIEVALVVLVWFSVLALFLTASTIRTFFLRFRGHFEKIMGVLLVAFGIKLALSKF